MPINLITGLPGHCKTLYMLNLVKSIAEKDNRVVYYNGIPELKLPWIEFDDGEKWYEAPVGAIIVIDEAQRIFRPRPTGSLVPKFVSLLETHRKAGHDIYLLTQHPMLIDSNVRRLVEKHYHCVRWFGMEKSTIHEFHKLQEQPSRSREGSIRHVFIYPKESYAWYKSAEVHTVKRSIPMRVWLLLASPLVIAGLLWVGYKTMRSSVDKAPSDKQVVSSKLADRANMRAGLSKSDADWLSKQRPRIVGLPHTAPQYDALTNPVAVPLPAACVRMRGVCACYTQQGTKIADVQAVICNQIVEEGWFNPYQLQQVNQQLPSKPVTPSQDASPSAVTLIGGTSSPSVPETKPSPDSKPPPRLAKTAAR